MGFGIISFLFAIPAVKTIDTFGRRNLLLTTIPFMALCLFFTGFSFLIPEETAYKARIACITAGIYLFGMVYSPGEGPVPFVYSAEAYPLYVRGYGMSLGMVIILLPSSALSPCQPSCSSRLYLWPLFSPTRNRPPSDPLPILYRSSTRSPSVLDLPSNLPLLIHPADFRSP